MKIHFYVLAMLIPISVHAQKISLGLGGGGNFSNLTHRSDAFDQSFESALGYFGGVAPTLHFGDKWSVVTELQYSVKKTKTSVTDISGIYDMFYQYAYAEVLPQVEFRPISLIGLRVGGTAGYKLTEALKIGEQDWQKPVAELFKDADFGLTGGLALHFGRLTVAGRYNLGLAKLSDITFTDEQGVPIETFDLHSRGIQAGLYYSFFK